MDIHTVLSTKVCLLEKGSEPKSALLKKSATMRRLAPNQMRTAFLDLFFQSPVVHKFHQIPGGISAGDLQTFSLVEASESISIHSDFGHLALGGSSAESLKLSGFCQIFFGWLWYHRTSFFGKKNQGRDIAIGKLQKNSHDSILDNRSTTSEACPIL